MTAPGCSPNGVYGRDDYGIAARHSRMLIANRSLDTTIRADFFPGHRHQGAGRSVAMAQPALFPIGESIHGGELRTAVLLSKWQAQRDRETADRLEVEGHALWAELVGDAPACIVAEYYEDQSDSMADYFGGSVWDTMILRPAKTARPKPHRQAFRLNFAEIMPRNPPVLNLGVFSGIT